MIQKDENMFNVYMMFSVVLYMLLIGSNVDNYLNIDYEDNPQMEGGGYMDVSATASDI